MGRDSVDGSDLPRTSGDKVDVRIDSLETLAAQLKDDFEVFDGQLKHWNQQSRTTHPLNAQFGTWIVEGSTVKFKNDSAAQLVRSLMEMVKMGIDALRDGADHLAKTYPGVDSFNQVEFALVERMFPEPKAPGAGDNGPARPSPDKWTVIEGKGWDFDGDGDVDEPFRESTSRQPSFNFPASDNDRPDELAPTTHEGYQKPVNDHMMGGADGVSQNFAEEAKKFEDSQPRVLAPGQFGGLPEPGTRSTGGSGTGVTDA